VKLLLKISGLCVLAGLVLALAGCATPPYKIWNPRIGNYTFDQAVVELGPPDKQARLENGTLVADWLTQRGYTSAYISPGYGGYSRRHYYPAFPMITETSSPDYFLRLVFGPDGRLQSWKTFAR
jgi:hypothetical protein